MTTDNEELFECVIPLPDALIRKPMDEPTKSVKHGDHDQSDHGSWAHGGASDRSGGNVSKYIRAHGLQTTVSERTVADRGDKEKAMWKIKKDTMNNSTLHWDHRNDTPEMRALRIQERQIETAATILAQGYKAMREVPEDNWRVIEVFAPDGSLAAATMGTLQDQGNGEMAFAMRFFGSLGTVEGAGTAIMAKALEMAADANAEFRLIKVQSGAHQWYQQWGFDTMNTSGEPDMSREQVADWVANYRASTTKSLKHGDHDQSDHGNWATGGSAGAGDTKDNPIRTSDVEEAARALGEGKHVQLSSPDQVATLLDRLNDLAKEAEAAGSKAKNIDLCNVTVPGTNLFCVESKGIPRVEMPQLKGIPNAGSAASDLEADKRGEVDITEAYLEQLRSSGVTLDEDDALASHLKATQNELNGNKVAGIMSAARAGELDLNQPIVVSRDGYIVDGHHRWAAKVALEHDGIDDPETDMKIPVVRVDQDILDILESSKQFAADMGLPQVAVKSLKHGDHDQSDHGNWAHGSATIPKLTSEEKKAAEGALLKQNAGWQGGNYQHAFQLTDLEVAAAVHYKGFGYMEMNNLLRGEGSDWNKEFAPEIIRGAELIKDAMEKASLQTGIKVYRGMHIPSEEAEKFLSSLKPGGVYTDPSFVSTSKSEKVASGFALDRAPDDRAENRTSIIWEMFAPEGTAALDFDKMFTSTAATEKEVLLASDTHFRILGAQREGYTSHGEPIIRVTATVIPTGTPPVKHADHDQSDHGSWADGSVPLAKTPIAQVDALRQWSSNSYDQVNKALRDPNTLAAQERGGNRDMWQKTQDGLDRLFKGVPPTTRPWTLYRGATGEFVTDIVKQYDAMIAKGEEEYRATGKPPTSFVLPKFTDKGFASTTPDKDVAMHFSGSGFQGGPTYTGEGRAIFEINLPEGSKMVNVEEYVNEFGGFAKFAAEESEFLLPRGLTFEVTDVTPSEDQFGSQGPLFYTIKLDVVPSSTKSLKHGDHDQSEHGNWARGGADHQYTGKPRSANSRARMSEHTDRYGDPERRENGRKAGSRNLGREVTYMEIVALESYKGGGYGEINRYLRGTQEGDDWTKDRVDAVKSLAIPTTEPMTVTRMMPLFAVEGIAAGQVYEDKGFMSTGKGDRPAQFFHGYPVQMQIEVPAGTPVVDFDNFSGLDGWGNIEREVTLMPNTQLQIDRVEQRNWNRDFGPTETDGLKVYARLIPATKSYKHADHDQSDHGSWATGSSPQFSEDENGAITIYQDQGHMEINRYLRGTSITGTPYSDEELVKKWTASLDSAITTAGPTTRPMTIYRGISGRHLEELRKGGVFEDLGFASFSKSGETASEFATGAAFGYTRKEGAVLELDLPAGSFALDMESHSMSTEQEVLLPRGSRFELISGPEELDLSNDEDNENNRLPVYQVRLIPPTKSLKHGDHDQSDHGNWARGGQAYSAGKWVGAGDKAAKEHRSNLVDKLWADRANMLESVSYLEPDRLREILEKETRYPNGGTPTVHANGQVTVVVDEKRSAQSTDAFIQLTDRAMAMMPAKMANDSQYPIEFAERSAAMSGLVMPGGGFANTMTDIEGHGGAIITWSPELNDARGYEPLRSFEPTPGWWAASETDVPAREYMMAHEVGHAVLDYAADQRDDPYGANYAQQVVRAFLLGSTGLGGESRAYEEASPDNEKLAISKYGTQGWHEFYAEHFAAWQFDKGNELTEFLAKQDDWRKP